LSKIIALITDFGIEDIYVGVMKGVISQINPQATIIDITHHIPPQNLYNANYSLVSAISYFPSDTIYVVVVDPGVGSKRKAIALHSPNNPYFIGPDNGLFTGILNQFPNIEARELTNQAYCRHGIVSKTFHGRDIFSPVAAHLASGVMFEHLGDLISLESLIRLPLPPYQVTPEGIIGIVQHIDHFGNIITTIPSDLVREKSWLVVMGEIQIPSQTNYSEVKEGELLSLISSDGWVEIAVNRGNAAERLQLKLGDSILIGKKE
jgi:S-adenosylmethionine hydrolase